MKTPSFITLIFTLLLTLTFILNPSYADADPDLENEDLRCIVNVLNSLTPIIQEARLQQTQDTRIEFQYSALQSDLNKIKAGIEQKLNPVTVEPRIISPVKGDYIIQKTLH
jgi:RAQPRD family integrative conjugative element protein